MVTDCIQAAPRMSDQCVRDVKSEWEFLCCLERLLFSWHIRHRSIYQADQNKRDSMQTLLLHHQGSGIGLQALLHCWPVFSRETLLLRLWNINDVRCVSQYETRLPHHGTLISGFAMSRWRPFIRWQTSTKKAINSSTVPQTCFVCQNRRSICGVWHFQRRTTRPSMVVSISSPLLD